MPSECVLCEETHSICITTATVPLSLEARRGADHPPVAGETPPGVWLAASHKAARQQRPGASAS